MSTSLDINTPRGVIAANDQLRAVEIVFGKASGFNFISTATNDSAAVDGFIVFKEVVNSVVEIKSRDMSYEQLMGGFNGEWLLTYQKLIDIQSVSKLLKIPSYGFIYLIPSSLVLVVRLTNKEGAITCVHRTDSTVTQACCNGGTALRRNAFIKVFGAKIYREKL